MAVQNVHASYTSLSPSSFENQGPTKIHAWLAHMESKVEKEQDKCIPRVPALLRDKEANKKCFDPVLVSLGPYHHGKPHLQRMEKYKFVALKRFTGDKLAIFYEQLEPVALQAKQWYEKAINISDEDFMKMIFMDSCFVLNFIDDYQAKQRVQSTKKSTQLMSSHDEVLVLRDMMMLENQIPFIVLSKLMSIKHDVDIIDLNHFNSFLDNLFLAASNDTKINIASKSLPNPEIPVEPEPIHLLDLLRKKMLGSHKETTRPQVYDSGSWFFSESVTELKEAGILCRKGNKMQLKEISIQKSLLQRVLFLPPIVIDDNSKYLFLNMIAYETGPGGPADYGVTSYICFMDALIDNEEDVKELRKHQVIKNALGTNKEVADFFNGLSTDLLSDSDAYADVMTVIHQHYKSPWVKFRVALLKLHRTYFNSPWATIGLFAGIFLLILAAIQLITLFSLQGMTQRLRVHHLRSYNGRLVA